MEIKAPKKSENAEPDWLAFPTFAALFMARALERGHRLSGPGAMALARLTIAKHPGHPVNYRTLQNWATGKTYPDPDKRQVLAQLARALEIPRSKRSPLARAWAMRTEDALAKSAAGVKPEPSNSSTSFATSKSKEGAEEPDSPKVTKVLEPLPPISGVGPAPQPHTYPSKAAKSHAKRIIEERASQISRGGSSPSVEHDPLNIQDTPEDLSGNHSDQELPLRDHPNSWSARSTGNKTVSEGGVRKAVAANRLRSSPFDAQERQRNQQIPSEPLGWAFRTYEFRTFSSRLSYVRVLPETKHGTVIVSEAVDFEDLTTHILGQSRKPPSIECCGILGEIVHRAYVYIDDITKRRWIKGKRRFIENTRPATVEEVRTTPLILECIQLRRAGYILSSLDLDANDLVRVKLWLHPEFMPQTK